MDKIQMKMYAMSQAIEMADKLNSKVDVYETMAALYAWLEEDEEKRREEYSPRLL